MPETRSIARMLGLALLLAIVLGGTWPYFERMLDANERPRLLAGIALVEQGSMRIDGPAAHGLALGPDVAEAIDGALVPNKPPGATLVASGAWLLLELRHAITGAAIERRGYTLLARALGALLPTLLLAFALWRRERASGEAAEHVDFAMLAWLLATPAWANAKLLFGHSLAAALLGGGLLVLTPATPKPLSPARAALAGLLCASAIAVEYTAAFAGPAIAIWLIWRERRRWPVILAALLGTLPAIVGLGLYHAAVFGSPWTTGYHRAAHDEFAAIHARGLLGLQWPSVDSLWEHLLSPWGGALVWCPLALLGLLAGASAARSEVRPESRARHALFAAVGLSLFVVLLGLEQGGGWRVGPRYFVLALPLAVPGLVVLTRELAQREGLRGLGFALLLGLFGASLVIEFLAANWFPHLIPHGNPLGDLLWPLALAGGRVHGLPIEVVSLATVLLVGVVLVRLRRASEHGLAAWLGGLALAGALVAAQSLGPVSEIDAEAELAAVRSIAEPDEQGRSPASTVLRAAE
ncbi:hypothetical protein ACNOYE_22210 [Nannocystaceae bacterium ST9]